MNPNICTICEIGDAETFGIGVGIHTGEVSFGEFGHSRRDLTAIGTVVNMAARAQAAAAPGQILVTRQVCDKAQQVCDKAQPELHDSPACEYRLKGFHEPIALYAA
jgi:class 3 adenylate cyclase